MKIELIVRSVCSIRPGVTGLSDNITVRSIVGRYLEHSRIFRFGVPSNSVLAVARTALAKLPGLPSDLLMAEGEATAPEGETIEHRADGDGLEAEAAHHASSPARYFIGSADLMERNLDRRIEAVVPIRELELCARLEEAIALDLADDTNAWELDGDGSWRRGRSSRNINAQARLQQLAQERAQRRHSQELVG